MLGGGCFIQAVSGGISQAHHPISTHTRGLGDLCGAAGNKNNSQTDRVSETIRNSSLSLPVSSHKNNTKNKENEALKTSHI